MKKTAQAFALSLGVLAVFFIALPAHAQSSHFVLTGQYQITSSTAFDTNNHFDDYKAGTGWVGTTTSAVVAISGLYTAGPGAIVRLDISGYSDSTYTTRVNDCAYDGQNRANGTYSATSSNPFFQLDHKFVEIPAGSCTFNPSLYYAFEISYNFTNAGAFYPGSIGGSSAFSRPGWTLDPTGNDYPFAPYFTIIADGFQITPTTSTSGLYLSGAQAFCNDRFSSSTNPVSGLANDFGNAICQAVGYLFIPTPESISQFSGLNTFLAGVIPFSYLYEVAGDFSGLSASTTANLPVWTVGLVDISSSTPLGHILPTSITVLSTSTIGTYFPDSNRLAFLFLERATIWFSLIVAFYRRALGIISDVRLGDMT